MKEIQFTRRFLLQEQKTNDAFTTEGTEHTEKTPVLLFIANLLAWRMTAPAI
jgi:hypothetical protein